METIRGTYINALFFNPEKGQSTFIQTQWSHPKNAEYSFSEKTWTIISKSKIITQSVIIRYITLM